MQSKLFNYLPYLLLAILAFTPIIGHIDTLPIRLWDEARLAVNAYEMYHNHNYIVTYFEGAPEMWNTKPPFMIWCQVACMHVFGITELAVRFPSAIATIVTCISMLWFSKRYFKTDWIGIIAVLILVTSKGYVNMHSTRSGDYDAMLTLFTTCSALAFFAYCETSKTKFLYLFFTCITLAVLTKSIAGLLFLPALFIYVLLQKKLNLFLKNKHTYIGIIIFLFFTAGYYLLREAYNEGYIAAVQFNELGGRFATTLEGHLHPFSYYYDCIISTNFQYYYLLIPISIAIGFSYKSSSIKKVTLFITLLITTFFIIISSAGTKLEWYDIPMYPFMALLCSISIFFVFDIFRQSVMVHSLLKPNVIPFVFLFVVFIFPYQSMFNTCYLPIEEKIEQKNFYDKSIFLQKAVAGNFNVNNQNFVYGDFNTHNLFYIKALKDKGVNVSVKNCETLQVNDEVIVSEYTIKKYIDSVYIAKHIGDFESVTIYKIMGIKKSTSSQVIK